MSTGKGGNMKNVLINIMVLFHVVVFLLGSATAMPQQVTYDEVNNILPHLDEKQGRIYFYRTSSKPLKNDNISPPGVWLNHQIVGRSISGGFFFVDVCVGEHIVDISNSGELIKLNLSPGEIAYVEAVEHSFKDVRPFLVDSEFTLKKIKKSRYTGANLLDIIEGNNYAKPNCHFIH